MSKLAAKDLFANRMLSPEARNLLLQEEIEAERTVALLRCILSLSTISLVGVVVLPDAGPQSLVNRQIPFIALYAFAFLALGVISLLFARTDRYRPWMTWAFSTGDLMAWTILMVAAIENFSVPGDYFVGAPPVVAAFGILAVVSLRNNPWLQSYALGFIILTIVVLYVLAPEPTPEIGSEFAEAFFRLPQNIIRLSIFALFGLTLAYGTWRTRALIGRAIEQTTQRMNLSRYLPPQIAGRLAQPQN